MEQSAEKCTLTGVAKDINLLVNEQDFWLRARIGWQNSVEIHSGIQYQCLNSIYVNIQQLHGEDYHVAVKKYHNYKEIANFSAAMPVNKLAEEIVRLFNLANT